MTKAELSPYTLISGTVNYNIIQKRIQCTLETPRERKRKPFWYIFFRRTLTILHPLLLCFWLSFTLSVLSPFLFSLVFQKIFKGENKGKPKILEILKFTFFFSVSFMSGLVFGFWVISL